MTKSKVIGGLVIAGALVVGFNLPSHRAGSDDLYPPKSITGIINPDITQSNIAQTICNPSWSTKSIRPSTSYTNQLKASQIKEFGFTDLNMANYEEDHFISLELGGSPTSPQNLWPESYLTSPNARDKDRTENYLHKQVCLGTMSLMEAQKEITSDWIAVFNQIKNNVGAISSDDPDDN